MIKNILRKLGRKASPTKYKHTKTQKYTDNPDKRGEGEEKNGGRREKRGDKHKI